MASVPFGVLDQTDEDFFDNLVDDEVVSVQSGNDFINHVDNSDVQPLGKLSIDEIDQALVVEGLDRAHDNDITGDSCEKSEKYQSNSSKLDGEGNVGVQDSCSTIESSELVDPMSDAESRNQVVAEESASDSVNCGISANVGGGVKEVQWSAFGGAMGEGSYSDFFSQFGDNGADPFADVPDSSVIGSNPDLFANVASSSVVESNADPFAGLAGSSLSESNPDPFAEVGSRSVISSNQDNSSSYFSFIQNEKSQQQVSSTGQTTEVQDESSSQYWENMYPGWKYDPNTGQWYQVDSSHATVNNVGMYQASDQSVYEGTSGDSKSDAYYLQQTAQSVSGNVAEKGMTETVSYWNQTPQGSTEYPAHMVFDPQYPGWYYDTIAQEWRSLESYTSSINQSATMDQNQYESNGNFTSGNYYEQNTTYGQGQGKPTNNYSHQQGQLLNWRDSGNSHHQQSMDVGRNEPFGNSEAVRSPQNTHFGNGYISSGQVNHYAEHRAGAIPPDNSSFYEQTSRSFSANEHKGFQGFSSGVLGSQNFGTPEKKLQPNNQRNLEFEQQYSAAYFNNSEALNFAQQPFHNTKQSSYAPNEGRSSAGRPPHALVAFGFGGKIIVMKDKSSLYTQSTYASQDSAGSVINVLNLMEAATLKSNSPDVAASSCDYFHTLCHQSFPGPLVSSNVGCKELNKWIDDRIANYSIPNMECRKGEALRMLFSLLKIACQFYGKLRSGFGADLGLKENDAPETAVAKLFASSKRNDSQFSAVAHCLQNMPSEGQIQAAANEVQMLLVSGKRIEALQCAQEGQLWGPAIVIAAMLGEQFYGETVKQMALHQLVAGSPLRTLCLLVAGQPAEVFSNSLVNNLPSDVNVTQPVQIGPGGMLNDWEENLAIITANRTVGDELVITHLGDCLWKERGEVTAAHICYLVAEANIESFSESARLCLVGADHLKCPRTYASPEAIQRTELYEYAKVLGNSQFILLPFQPYKLIYACMLAEIGRLSDSLKYCQAALRSLKAGRSSEVDTWRNMINSLEERIKVHHQGGYGANLAPNKLVGKLWNFFDNTAHRVVGGLPPPIPSPSHSNGQHIEPDNQSRGPRVSTSQSTMAISSLPSESTDGGNHKLMHNRSISEPDIGRTPRKVESPKETNSSEQQDPASAPSGSSRFGRFGSQIFQKTIGLVLRSRQAKLGEKNKFYYDEKLKRWVEEGAEPPAEEPALAPPPTTAAFMNGMQDHHDKKSGFANGTLHANGEPEIKPTNAVEKFSGAPPIPPGSNQFSARGRTSVRARYVDTFNKGGTTTTATQVNSFQSSPPSIPYAKGPALGKANFFIPAPVTKVQETTATTSTKTTPKGAVTDDDSTSISEWNQAFSPPQIHPPSPAINRHPSTKSLPCIGITGTATANDNSSLPPPHSRRTLSWNGGLGDPLNPPSPFGDPSNSAGLGDDLQEVQL